MSSGKSTDYITDQERQNKIEIILDQIRPTIQMDGGDVEFVRFQDGIVYVRLVGACVGCPASSYTVKLGIEQAIKDVMPDVFEVIALDEDEE
jgi:Fe-S cluster biogenesis protein NfuA